MAARAWRTQGKVSPVTVLYADGREAQVDPHAFVKQPYWKSAAWRARRRAVLQRDNHRCTVCKRTHGARTDPRLKGNRRTVLEVHHLTYARYGRERLADLVTLCQRCHATEHQWQKRRGGKASVR